MKLLLRFEEFGLFGLSIYLFALLAIRWWWFPVLLLTPDVTMVAYVGGPRLGAIVYDLAHHRAVALLIYGAGIPCQSSRLRASSCSRTPRWTVAWGTA